VTLAVTGITIFGLGFRRPMVPVFQWRRLPLIGSRYGKRWVIGRRSKPTLCVCFCVFPVFSVAVMVKGWDAYGDREHSLRSSFSASERAVVSEASVAVDRKSM
jgi:hypothetical protein